MGKLRSWKRKTRANRNRAERWRHSGLMKKRYSIISDVQRKYNAGYRYFENCSYHPCEITDITLYSHDGDINGTSLLSGKETSCSICHCGVWLMKEEQAFERRNYASQYGMLPFMLKYIYMVSDNAETLIAGLVKQENEWNFSQNRQVDFVTDAGREHIAAQYGVSL